MHQLDTTTSSSSISPTNQKPYPHIPTPAAIIPPLRETSTTCRKTHHHSSAITFTPFPRTQICTTIASSFTATPLWQHLQTLRRPPPTSLRESRSNITFSPETTVTKTSMSALFTNATTVAMAATSPPSKIPLQHRQPPQMCNQNVPATASIAPAVATRWWRKP